MILSPIRMDKAEEKSKVTNTEKEIVNCEQMKSVRKHAHERMGEVGWHV